MSGRNARLTYLQADNQMKTFSDLTGGMHFAPRFAGELPDDVKEINQNIRVKIRAGVPPDERQAGRDIPQDSCGTGGRRGPAAAHAGREAQAAEIRHYCSRRLSREAGSGIGKTLVRFGMCCEFRTC